MVTYPSDWTESKLLDHVELVQGLTYTPENVKPHGTLVLRSSNIQDGHLALVDNVYVNTYIPEEKKIQAGDILVCVRNGSSALIGKSCVLPTMSNTTFGAFMSVLRGDSTGYIAKVFESDIVQEQVRGRSNATINQITKKDFKSITVTIPDEPEQKAIASVLSSFDSYISDLGELIEKKKAIRDGALEDLVSGRTRLAGFTEPWKEMRLNQFTDINPKTIVPDTFMYVDLESVVGIDLISPRREKASTAPSRARRYARKGDVFYQTVRPYQKNNYLFNLDGDYVFSTGYAQLRTDNDYRFLFLLIRLDSFVNKVLDSCTGTSYPAINPTRLGEIPVFVPVDKKEQKAIADVLTAMDDEITALEDEQDKMIQIREGAMDDLLTGRVRLSI